MRRGHRLGLAAVVRYDRFREQLKPVAQHDEIATDPANRSEEITFFNIGKLSG
jgi:hypothetical protein